MSLYKQNIAARESRTKVDQMINSNKGATQYVKKSLNNFHSIKIGQIFSAIFQNAM